MELPDGEQTHGEAAVQVSDVLKGQVVQVHGEAAVQTGEVVPGQVPEVIVMGRV